MDEGKKLHKPATSIDEQVENLVSLGLKFHDKDGAKKVLRQISYFRLIKAYSISLKSNGCYKEGVYFEDILRLYQFNEELCDIVAKRIRAVEIMLRTMISNYFSLKYGVLGYLDEDNFLTKDGKYYITIAEIKREIKRNYNSPFIKNFRENYVGGQLPLYAAVEVCSFGTLAKLFQNMKHVDRNNIARKLKIPYFYLESWIQHFSFIRNICAHYGRLYNVKLTKKPVLFREFHNIVNPQTIFATIVNLLFVNDKIVFLDFIDQLEKLFLKYPEVNIECIGFPKNWKEILKDKCQTLRS